MKIYFDESNYFVQAELAQYDVGNLAEDASLDEAKAADYVLDDSEIALARGFDELMEKLTSSCTWIAPRGPFGEYNVVPSSTPGCEAIPMVEAEASTQATPNGKVFPGVIVNIPGGEFEMGSTNGDNDERKSDGTTVKVRMSGFRLAKTETTVGQYKAYLATTGDPTFSKLPDYDNNKKGDNYPVVGLDFLEKDAFCKYYGGTLPTAAQIEYASKGPTHNDTYGTPIDKAILWENGARTTAKPCGDKDERSNGWACDLAGNVWETTSDVYDHGFYDHASMVDPSNPYKDSGWLEFRGGSFSYDHGVARAAFRDSVGPDDRDYGGGFRCAWPHRTPNKRVIL